MPKTILITKRDNQYIEWMGQIAHDSVESNYAICRFLHKIPFRWSIPMDENRAIDGLQIIRNQYIETVGPLSEQYAMQPCTVLEMLLALAVRIDRDIVGDPGEQHPERWFWIMIDNLFDFDYTQRDFERLYGQDAEKRIDDWLNKKYDHKGVGSPFPLKGICNFDMRNLQIWDQFCKFLDENF